MKMRTFRTTLWREGSLCAIRVPFDTKAVFGKTRAPVKVTLNGYTYRSTTAPMHGQILVPLRASHRQAAGLEGTETLQVKLELDTETREIAAPADLVTALKAAPPAWQRWEALSFSHQREYVEAIDSAKKSETRRNRIDRTVSALLGATRGGRRARA